MPALPWHARHWSEADGALSSASAGEIAAARKATVAPTTAMAKPLHTAAREILSSLLQSITVLIPPSVSSTSHSVLTPRRPILARYLPQIDRLCFDLAHDPVDVPASADALSLEEKGRPGHTPRPRPSPMRLGPVGRINLWPPPLSRPSTATAPSR